MGVFLSVGAETPSASLSITSTMAYWVGGIDTLGQGEPSIRRIKSLACIQATQEVSLHNTPISRTIQFTTLKPLVRGALGVVKPYLIKKQDEIKKDREQNAFLAQEDDNTA